MVLKSFKSYTFLLGILIITACKKEENFSSRISFVNAAVSNPSITLKADSQSIFTDLSYGSLINTVASSGTFGITLFVNGVAQRPFTTNLESGQPYIGMTYEDTAGKGGYFIRKDALPGTPPQGQCSIRIYNAIADTVALYLANDTARKRQIIGSLGFRNFLSNPGFVTIDTIQDASIRIDSPRLVTLLPRPLRSGKIYTLYLTGRMKDTTNSTSVLKPKVIMQEHN